MTWSYSGDPSGSNLDSVRFKIGDTDTNDQLLSDEEISYLITNEGNVLSAAIQACYSIAAKFSRQADKGVGALRINASQKAKAYRTLAKELETQKNVVCLPFSGGAVTDNLEDLQDDTSAVQPKFYRDQFEND
jgi:hypothetical protein